MSLEKQFRWVTDRVKIGEAPVGKMALLLLFMGVPGKFIPKMTEYLILRCLKGKVVGADYYKKVAMWKQIISLGAGLGAAIGFKKWRWLRERLGETGTEALALGTLAGTVDGGFSRLDTAENFHKDFTDKISEGAKVKLLKLVGKTGVDVASLAAEISPAPAPAPAPTETEAGAFPERAPGEEEYIGPEAEFGSPEEDPVEELDKALSRLR